MNIISYFVVSIIFFIVMLVINIIKQLDIISILLKPLIGSMFIFGILFIVEMIFKNVLKIEIYETNNTESKKDDNLTETGKNVDFVVDDSVFTENNLESKEEVSESSVNDNSYSENLNVSDEINHNEIHSDEEIEFENDIDFSDVNTKSSSGKKSNEDIIKNKVGFDASYEDMANAIRTTLKRDKE